MEGGRWKVAGCRWVTVHTWGNTHAWKRGRPAFIVTTRAGCPPHGGRCFGKPLRAISRFSHQDAQTPPSPTRGEGGLSRVEFLFCRILLRSRFGSAFTTSVKTFWPGLGLFKVLILSSQESERQRGLRSNRPLRIGNVPIVQLTQERDGAVPQTAQPMPDHCHDTRRLRA